ncbi:MAG: DUF58 domain-containing protein [Sandaracinaceae bacterium]
MTFRARLHRFGELFPLTLLGVIVAAMCGLAIGYGVALVDLVLLGAGAIVAIAILYALCAVGIGVLVVRRALSRLVSAEGTRFYECGTPRLTGFGLPRPWWMPGLRLSWRWLSPNADVRVLRGGTRLEEQVHPRQRGWSDTLTREITLGDPFGLASVTLHHTEAVGVRMLPSVGGLRSMHVVRTLAGGSDLSHPEGTPEGDRLDLRQYAPGDPIRYVLWRVFARTRELVVRQPERALAAAKKTLAYLVAGSGDEPAAGAARVAVDVGALGGDWAFGADGVPEPASTKDAAFEALAKSATATSEEQGIGLARFIERASKEAGGRTVVFCPGRPGPWLDGVIESAKRIPRSPNARIPLEFVVCTDGVSPRRNRAWLKETLIAGPEPGPDEGVAAEELQRVVQTLGQLRARVIVVDRRDGHVHVAGNA